MLKHIEDANVYYLGSDVRIQYDDDSWSFAEKDIKGLEVTLKTKPRFRKFGTLRLRMVSVSAHFTLILSIRGVAEIVSDQSLRDVIFPYDNSGIDLNEQIERKAIELTKEMITDNTKNYPMRFTHNDKEIYWLFDGKFYKDSEDLSRDDVRALLVTRNRMRKARINRAKTIANAPDITSSQMRRGFIPEDTRLLVWERDGGMCAKCGSTTELQFDHVIPFSLGGGSTSDNLQILCGPCNRVKSNSIA